MLIFVQYLLKKRQTKLPMNPHQNNDNEFESYLQNYVILEAFSLKYISAVLIRIILMQKQSIKICKVIGY